MKPYGWMVFETAAPPDIRYFSFSGDCGRRLYLSARDVTLIHTEPCGGFTLENRPTQVEYNHCQEAYYKTLNDPRRYITEGGAVPECPACLTRIIESLYESYLLSNPEENDHEAKDTFAPEIPRDVKKP